MTLIPDLERDLLAAATKGYRRGLPRRRWRTTLAVAVGAVVLGGAAGAATGVLPVGSVIRGEGFHSEGAKRSVRERVVAVGEAPVSGRWRMTTFATNRKVPCLKLTLLDLPRAAGSGSSTGYCGHFRRFDEFGYGTRAAARRRGEVLLFGPAPAAATQVRLTAEGGKRIAVRPQTRSGGRRFWLLAAPPALRGARLNWLDREGRAPGRPVDVSYRFEGPVGRVLVAKGAHPLTGPWRMTFYESKGSTAEGDRYEPEGLPGLELSLPRPPAGFPHRGGGTGVIRNAPGFARGQHTLRDRRNRVLGMVLYGRAPERADHVRVAAAGGVRLIVRTRKGPAGVPGRFWFTATKTPLRDGHVRWVDSDTGEIGPAVAVLPP